MQNYSSWRLRSNNIIIKVVTHVIGDLRVNWTEDLLVARNEIVSSFFSYRFCSADFSKTPRSIYMKFSQQIPYDKMLLYFFLSWWRHFRFRNIDDFVTFDRSFCPDRFSKMGKDRHLKFSRMIDKGLKLVPFESQVSNSKSAGAR